MDKKQTAKYKIYNAVIQAQLFGAKTLAGVRFSNS